MQHRELSSVLRDDLDGLDGAVGGKEAQEGGDVCMLLLLLSHFSRVRLLATPWTAAH